MTTVELKLSDRSYRFFWHYFVTLLPGNDPDATWLSRDPVKNATASKVASEFFQEIMHFPIESLTWIEFLDKYNTSENPIEVNVTLEFDIGTKGLKYSFNPREFEPYGPEWPFISAALMRAKHA